MISSVYFMAMRGSVCWRSMVLAKVCEAHSKMERQRIWWRLWAGKNTIALLEDMQEGLRRTEKGLTVKVQIHREGKEGTMFNYSYEAIICAAAAAPQIVRHASRLCWCVSYNCLLDSVHCQPLLR